MRKLLSAAIICSVLTSPLAFSELEKNTDFNPYSEVWKNQDSKEWGDTPLFVKTLVIRISDVYEKDKKENMVSPFSVIWLQQVLKEPEKYNLTKEDQNWIKTALVRSAEKGSDQWRPVINQENKDVELVKSIDNKNVEKTETPVEKPEISAIAVVDNTIKPEEKNEVQKNETPLVVADNTVKTDDKKDIEKKVPESKIENSVIAKKEDIKVVEKAEIVKNKTKEINNVVKNSEKDKANVIVMKNETKKGIEEIIIPIEKVSNVNIKNENNSKIQAILNENNWLPSVIKQLLLIMSGMSVIFYMIFRNKKTNIVKEK